MGSLDEVFDDILSLEIFPRVTLLSAQMSLVFTCSKFKNLILNIRNSNLNTEIEKICFEVPRGRTDSELSSSRLRGAKRKEPPEVQSNEDVKRSTKRRAKSVSGSSFFLKLLPC